MIKLEIGNSICKLYGITNEQLAPIRLACSYTTVEMVYRRFRKVRKYLMTKKGDFPTGLLYLVKQQLEGLVHEVIDTRIVPTLGTISKKSLYLKKKHKPRVEQVEASESALKFGRGIIVAPTGSGKSVICELICDKLRVKTLIVVPSLGLKSQLTISMRESFGKDMVGPLPKNGIPEYPISIENVDALDPKVKLQGVDCVIIDEFHRSGSNTYRDLNLYSWTNVYYKIGLTATPFRSKSDERLLLESVLSETIYKIEYQTAIDKGYIVPMEVYYIDIPKEPRARDFNKYLEAYNHYVVNNNQVNDILANMIFSLIKERKSTLILTRQLAHGKQLQALLEGLGEYIEFAEGTSKLKLDNIKDFNNCETIALIGTVGVLGEGIDTRPAEYIILAGGGRSKNAFMQNVGRGFRKFEDKESCKIVMIRNPNNKWLLDHFNQCCSYLLEEYNIVPVKLNLEF